jgi:type IV pilus assembly protein PilA
VSEAAPEWSQHEAIVEQRWDYYRARFERFAAGAWLSWNWAAFFATFAWLRYRRMPGWSWAYLGVSSPALLAYLIVWQAAGSDACMRAIEPGNATPAVLLGLLLLGWIIPPLFANRLYFAHVRSVLQREVEGKPDVPVGVKQGYWGNLAVQVLPVFFVAVWAPSYGNYITRAKVAEGISMASALKTPVAEYLADQGRLPSRAEDVAAATRGKFVSALSIQADGTIRAVFGDHVHKLSGRSVLVVPTIQGRTVSEWTCRSNDLPDQCLPVACRRAR